MLYKNKKAKILFIHHGEGIGGALISLVNLINNLDKGKYDIKVGLLTGGEAERVLLRNNIKYEVIGGTRNYFAHNKTPKIHWRYIYRYVKIYKHWRNTSENIAPKFLEKHKPDVVHLNSHVLTDWAYSASKMNIKVILHNREAISHGYFGIRFKILKRLIKENCDYIINISEDNRRRLGIKSNNSVVIYNFVDIPHSYRSPMQDTEGKIKILYLGGMAYIKGFPTVVKALKHLNSGIIIQFAGNYGRIGKDETLKGLLKDWVKKNLYPSYKYLKIMHESANAEYLGLLKNPFPYINAADILITPFTKEHFSRPAIEAFAYGKPVIGSNVEGMSEIINHNKNGILVPKEAPVSLAKAINLLCENPELCKKMGQEGRRKAITNFSPRINTLKVENIYDELLKDKL